MFGQRRFYFSKLDSIPVDLDLKINSSEYLQIAVRKVAAHVTRLIKTIACYGMSRELCTGRFRITPIPNSQSHSFSKHFSRNPLGSIAQAIVHDVVSVVGDRPAVRNAGPQ